MRLIDYIYYAKIYAIHEKSPKIPEISTLEIEHLVVLFCKARKQASLTFYTKCSFFSHTYVFIFFKGAKKLAEKYIY